MSIINAQDSGNSQPFILSEKAYRGGVVAAITMVALSIIGGSLLLSSFLHGSDSGHLMNIMGFGCLGLSSVIGLSGLIGIALKQVSERRQSEKREKEINRAAQLKNEAIQKGKQECADIINTLRGDYQCHVEESCKLLKAGDRQRRYMLPPFCHAAYVSYDDEDLQRITYIQPADQSVPVHIKYIESEDYLDCIFQYPQKGFFTYICYPIANQDDIPKIKALIEKLIVTQHGVNLAQGN